MRKKITISICMGGWDWDRARRGNVLAFKKTRTLSRDRTDRSALGMNPCCKATGSALWGAVLSLKWLKELTQRPVGRSAICVGD